MLERGVSMIKYNINYEKRTITAYFEGGKEYWIRSLEDMADKIVYDSNFNMYTRPDIKKIVNDYQMGAVVKCHPKDNFDEELGKELAKKKLNERFNRCKIRVLKYISNEAFKSFNQLNQRITAKAKKGVK